MKTRWDILLNPIYLASLFLLFLNDFVLKYSYPGFVTGKLSDLAGIFAFTVFLMALFSKQRKIVVLFSGLWFIYWKSPYSQVIIDAVNQVSFYKIDRVVDYTDLWAALLMLPIAWFFVENTHKVYGNSIHIARFSVLLSSLFVFGATTRTSGGYFNNERGIIYHSKKSWHTPKSIYQLEQHFQYLSNKATSDPDKKQWELYDVHLRNNITVDISLSLVPKKRRTQIILQRLYVCNSSFYHSERSFNHDVKEIIQISESYEPPNIPQKSGTKK